MRTFIIGYIYLESVNVTPEKEGIVFPSVSLLSEVSFYKFCPGSIKSLIHHIIKTLATRVGSVRGGGREWRFVGVYVMCDSPARYARYAGP